MIRPEPGIIPSLFVVDPVAVKPPVLSIPQGQEGQERGEVSHVAASRTRSIKTENATTREKSNVINWGGFDAMVLYSPSTPSHPWEASPKTATSS